MATLYEITGEMLMLMDMMEEDPENEFISDTLEGLAGDLEAKADGYCKVIFEYDHESEKLESEIKRLQARKSVVDNNITRLKGALFNAMQTVGMKKIRGDLFSLTIKNNGVSLDNIPDNLPEKYLLPQPAKVDKKQLLADIKAGAQVEGVTTKRTQSLLIK